MEVNEDGVPKMPEHLKVGIRSISPGMVIEVQQTTKDCLKLAGKLRSLNEIADAQKICEEIGTFIASTAVQVTFMHVQPQKVIVPHSLPPPPRFGVR